MATATQDRSPRTARKEKTVWTDEERAKIIAKARTITDDVAAGKRLELAMMAVLPESRWRNVVNLDFTRMKWFLDAMQADTPPPPKPPPKPAPAPPVQSTQSNRIEWTLEEKAELIAAGREIRRGEPKLSARRVLEKAQREALPPERQRNFIGSIPPDRMKWYTDALEGELVELPPVMFGELQEYPLHEDFDVVAPAAPPSPAVATGKTRRRPVFWSHTDLELLLARARELYDQSGGDSPRSLIDRAQHDVLPPEKWRERASLGSGSSGQYLLKKMSEWTPHEATRPSPPEPANYEPARLALASYAFPPPLPPPPPEPDPIDMQAVAAEALDQMDTIDLAAVLARRIFGGVRPWMGTVSEAIRSLLEPRDRDSELLRQIVSDLAVAGVRRVASDPGSPQVKPAEPVSPQVKPDVEAAESVARAPGPLAHRIGSTPPPPVVAAPARKMKACIVGGNAEFGKDVCKAVSGVIDLDHNPSVNVSGGRAFKGYDIVFTTPISGNAASKMAKNQIGRDRVYFINATTAGKIAEEIRQTVGKLAFRRAKALEGATNGAY